MTMPVDCAMRRVREVVAVVAVMVGGLQVYHGRRGLPRPRQGSIAQRGHLTGAPLASQAGSPGAQQDSVIVGARKAVPALLATVHGRLAPAALPPGTMGPPEVLAAAPRAETKPAGDPFGVRLGRRIGARARQSYGGSTVRWRQVA